MASSFKLLLAAAFLSVAILKIRAEMVDSNYDVLCHEETSTVDTDIILVVDRSDSISHDDFKLLQNALSQFITEGLSKTNTTRVSLISFGGTVSIEFDFIDGLTAAEIVAIIQGIDRSKEDGRFTLTYSALDLARKVLVNQVRESANLYVILFTDGASNGRKNARHATIESANKLKSSRAMKLITVGIGSEINRDELIAVSTDGIEGSTALIIDGYQKLAALIESYIIKETVCSIIKIPDPPKPACQNGMLTTGILITPISGSGGLSSTAMTVFNQFNTSATLPNPVVKVFESEDDSNWDLSSVNIRSRTNDLIDMLAKFKVSDNRHTVNKRIIIVLVNEKINPKMKQFFQALAERKDFVTIIPMDVSGANGQYELRKIGRIGGYGGTACLLCGGIHEYSISDCQAELAELLTC